MARSIAILAILATLLSGNAGRPVAKGAEVASRNAIELKI